MGFLLSKVLPLLLYPLGLGLVLQLLGQVTGAMGRNNRHPSATALGRSRWGEGKGGLKRFSPWLSGAGIGILWVFAMPLTSRQLIWGLEDKAAALTPQKLPRADAVVVLGGGLRPGLPPRAGVEVAEGGDRLLTGVRLMRQGRAAWLVTSGGRVSFTRRDPASPEALWARELAMEWGVPQRKILINPASRTTAEEARDIGRMGQQRGWRRVILVTSAFHMPRSLATFRRVSGLDIVPVACDYQLPSRANYGQPTAGNVLKSLVPDAEALHLSTLALKEHLGLLVYRWQGRL